METVRYLRKIIPAFAIALITAVSPLLKTQAFAMENTVGGISGNEGIESVYQGILHILDIIFDNADDIEDKKETAYGNDDVTLDIPDISYDPAARAEIVIPTYIPIEEYIDIDKETRNFEELTEYLEENVDVFDRNTFVIDKESSSGDDRSYSVFYYYMKNGFKTTYYIAVRCTDGVPEKYFISVPDNISALYTERTISADDIPETVIDEAKDEAVKDINEGKYKGLRIISQTVTPRIYEDGYKYLRVRTIFEYEDDGDVYQFPHRFEYKLPDEWQQ